MSILAGFAPSPGQSGFLLFVKVVFGLVLFVGAIQLAFNLVAKFEGARSSDAWPESLATITEAKVNRKGLGIRPAYSPFLIYKFEVGGQRYTGTQIALAASDSRSESEAAGIVQKYSVGSQPPVYYDPKNPRQSQRWALRR